MIKEDFDRLLKIAGFNKKNFAKELGIAQQTVNCWGTTQNIPYWVESWLENYIKAKTYKDIREKIFEIEKYEQKNK